MTKNHCADNYASMIRTEYLTSLEASAMLGELPTTGGTNICALARAGKIPGAEKIGRDWLIPRAWAEEKAERKKLAESGGKPKRGRPPGRPKKPVSTAKPHEIELDEETLRKGAEAWENLGKSDPRFSIAGDGIDYRIGKECPNCCEAVVRSDGYWRCKSCGWRTSV